MAGVVSHMLGVNASAGGGGVTQGSYYFDGNDYIDGAISVSGARTLVAWIKRDASSGNMVALATGETNTGDADQTSSRLTNFYSGTPFSRATSTIANGSISNGTGPNFTNETWVHIAAVFPATNSRTAYTDGVAGTTDTSTRAFGAATVAMIGSVVTTSRTLFMAGYIAHAAVWDIALSGAEIASLAAGALPSSIQSGNLIFYAPLNEGVAEDVISGNPLTVSGAVPSGDGPPI